MKKLYEKNELTFAIVWIVVYCVLQSLANPFNKVIGIEYAASAVFCILQAIVLLAFLRKSDLLKRYGLCKSSVPARRFLYYVPLIVMASGNLWNGTALNYSPTETVCRIVCMLCVGFLEEVIFRGLLFEAIAKDNVKSAIVISSVTFGIGHIINLFNGSGMNLLNNLCQIVFAIAVGFLLVTIFYRGGSLLPCIFVHSAINTLGTFANDVNLTTEMRLIHLGILIVITVAYTLILTKTLPKNDGDLQIKQEVTEMANEDEKRFHAILHDDTMWLSQQGNDLDDCLLHKLSLVDDAYQKLLTDEARELLDSAGCADTEITWGSEPVEAVEAIMQTAGLRG